MAGYIYKFWRSKKEAPSLLKTRPLRQKARTAIIAVASLTVIVTAFIFLPPLAKADITENLLGHWNFDEGSGTTAADSSGNGNTGNLVGNVTWVPGHNGGTAVQFDGIGAQSTASETVNVGIGTGLGAIPMHTLSAWVKFEPGYVGGGQWANIIGRTSGFNFPYMLYINASGRLRAHIMQSNGGVRLVDSAAAVPTGQWVHVMQMADGNRLRIFINGVEDPNSTTYDGTMANFPAANTYIGQDTREYVLKGAIDDARIYSRALTSDEISGLANGQVRYRKTVSPVVTTITPGQTFTYTVTVENTGGLDLTGLSFTDDLSDVVDDATYNNDVSASSGTASFNGPDEISWSGNLNVGQTATITYSLTMNDPATGNGTLKNSIVGTGPGSNCTADPAVDPDCMSLSPLPVLSSQKTLVSPTNPNAGDMATYSFTITNTGAAGVSYVSAADDMSGMLDDATYNNDAVASSGNLEYDPVTKRLSWNGSLAASGNAGDSVTVTYTINVNGADTILGDARLNNALITPDCPNPAIFDTSDPNYEANCVTSTPITAWTASKTRTTNGALQPGQTVDYTITVKNTGAVDLTGIDAPTVTDDMTDVVDDAVYNDDVSATTGTPTFSNPSLNWTGDLNAGQTAVITYSTTIKQQEELVNSTLVNTLAGSMNCPAVPITDPNDPNFNADCAVITQISPDATPAPTPDTNDTPANESNSLADTGESTLPHVLIAGIVIFLGFVIASRRLS